EGDGSGGSLLRDSLQIVAADGVTVLATSNLQDVTRTFFQEDFPLFGGTTYEELIWEVFLPGYTGDFSVKAEIMIHASLQSLRVDSFVQPVPEPAGATLLVLGGLGLAVVRSRTRKAAVAR